MIAEAISKLQELYNKGRDFQVDKLPGDRPGRFFIMDDDGNPHFHEVEAPDRIGFGSTLEDIVRNASSPYGKGQRTEESVIFYDGFNAVLLFDHERKNNLLKWSAPPSRELKLFGSWYEKGADGMALSVDDAVQLFDTFLRPCIPSPEWLKQISSLKVISETASEAARDATSSMAGGLVKSEVTSPMPDGEVEFRVRAVQDPTFPRIPLKCYIRADLVSRQWVFTVQDDSWFALHEAQAKAVADRLSPAREYVTDIIRGDVEFQTNAR